MNKKLLMLFILIRFIPACSNFEALYPPPSGVFAQTTNGYPGIVLIYPQDYSLTCSGTVVSAYAVLTASHCITAGLGYWVQTQWGTFLSSETIKFGSGLTNDTNDLGLIIFSNSLFEFLEPGEVYGKVYSISSSYAVGDTVRLVGFGCNDFDTRAGAGVKRTATNLIHYSGGFWEVISPIVNPVSYGIASYSNTGATCFGDSGSGWIEQSNGNDTLSIFGITHSGGESQYDYSYAVDLTLISNYQWLKDQNSENNLGISFN